MQFIRKKFPLTTMGCFFRQLVGRERNPKSSSTLLYGATNMLVKRIKTKRPEVDFSTHAGVIWRMSRFLDRDCRIFEMDIDTEIDIMKPATYPSHTPYIRMNEWCQMFFELIVPCEDAYVNSMDRLGFDRSAHGCSLRPFIDIYEWGPWTFHNNNVMSLEFALNPECVFHINYYHRAVPEFYKSDSRDLWHDSSDDASRDKMDVSDDILFVPEIGEQIMDDTYVSDIIFSPNALPRSSTPQGEYNSPLSPLSSSLRNTLFDWSLNSTEDVYPLHLDDQPGPAPLPPLNGDDDDVYVHANPLSFPDSLPELVSSLSSTEDDYPLNFDQYDDQPPAPERWNPDWNAAPLQEDDDERWNPALNAFPMHVPPPPPSPVLDFIVHHLIAQDSDSDSEVDSGMSSGHTPYRPDIRWNNSESDSGTEGLGIWIPDIMIDSY